eukprot:g24654.t1
MRTACGIHCGDLQATLESYDFMSRKFFTHATPTLFNAGTPKPQMSSCFLLTMKDTGSEDSIEGIYETLKQCAVISKSAGGIGVAISKIRATGSYVRGDMWGGASAVPNDAKLRSRGVFGSVTEWASASSKRIHCLRSIQEPWHADVFEFLELRKNHGKEEQRARDLFFGLWVPDLFMKRVKEDKDWTLFCPNEAYDTETGKGLTPGLLKSKREFRWRKLEAQQKGRRTVRAQQLWWLFAIWHPSHCLHSPTEKILGCIFQLAGFAEDFDFQKLYEVTKVVTRNLNKVIDRNYYPLEEARRSNLRHRPVGLGVQGLADVFLMMKLPFESSEAQRLNEDGLSQHGSYESYVGSPASQGLLQFDLWGAQPKSGRWDWARLKKDMALHGLRNSLLVAPMPTASTAQILGNNESFEPYTQNLYVRRVLSGEFVQVNRHLLKDLIARGLYNEELRTQLIAENGSSPTMFCCGSSRDVEEPQRLKHARFDHGRPQKDWGTGPTGQRLGGLETADVGTDDRRAAALAAAERRQVPQGVSATRAKDGAGGEELVGRLVEQYQRLGEEMPMGLKLASVEQLKKHLESLRSR